MTTPFSGENIEGPVQCLFVVVCWLSIVLVDCGELAKRPNDERNKVHRLISVDLALRDRDQAFNDGPFDSAESGKCSLLALPFCSSDRVKQPSLPGPPMSGFDRPDHSCSKISEDRNMRCVNTST